MMTGLSAALGLAVAGAAQAGQYEVWVSDQTNSAGISATADTGTHGGFIRIYDKTDIDSMNPTNNPVVIDVATWANGTGGNVVRLHGMLPSPNHNYMNVNFVGSGHAAIVDGRTRTPVALFRSTGTTTGRQNHMSFWSPDGRYLLIANQNGKLLERVNVTWDTNNDNIVSAVFDKSATLDLAGDLTSRVTAGAVADTANYPIASVSGSYATQSTSTPNGAPKEAAGVRPNNAVICPIAVSDNQHAFVTLAGGGMFVVDYTVTPMAIVAEYDVATIPAAGCGGIEAGGFVHIDEGTSAASPTLSRFFVYRFPLSYPSAPFFNPPNTPAPLAVYSDPDNLKNCATDPTCAAPANRDAHGMAASKHGRYLWQFDRIRNNVDVLDVANFPTLANRVDLTASGVCGTTLGATGSNDPTPDLLDIAPEGNRMFVALRGPFPLTISHAAAGSCPGLGIIKVTQGGKQGELIAVLPTFQSNYAGTKNISDPHGAAVRRK
jgi:hypothetical protein